MAVEQVAMIRPHYLVWSDAESAKCTIGRCLFHLRCPLGLLLLRAWYLHIAGLEKLNILLRVELVDGFEASDDCDT